MAVRSVPFATSAFILIGDGTAWGLRALAGVGAGLVCFGFEEWAERRRKRRSS